MISMIAVIVPSVILVVVLLLVLALWLEDKSWWRW